MTSSEMNSAPLSLQILARNALKSSRGGTTPMLPGEASVITAAIWSPYSANAAATAAWSLYGSTIVSAVVASVTPGVPGMPSVRTPEPAWASSAST